MRKGFFHIVEVVIVAMLVFIVLMQFYAVPKAEHPWETTKLTVLTQDILYSLDADGVVWTDKAQVSAALGKLVPETLSYSVAVKADVKPRIRVGCVCGDAQFAVLRDQVLGDFTLNGILRDVTLDSAPIAASALDLSEGGAQSDRDIIVFFGTPDLSSAQIDGMYDFLGKGGGIVQVADLTEPEVGIPWHQELFNLAWVDSFRPASPKAIFTYFDPSEKRYAVQKIFRYAHTPFPAFTAFDNFGSVADGENKVYPADGLETRIIVRQEDNYQAGSYDGKPVPLSVINWGVEGIGRTAWMAGASIDQATPADGANRKLLESLILWAGSEKEDVIVPGLMKQWAKASVRKALTGQMYEAMRVDLIIGYHY